MLSVYDDEYLYMHRSKRLCIKDKLIYLFILSNFLFLMKLYIYYMMSTHNVYQLPFGKFYYLYVFIRWIK